MKKQEYYDLLVQKARSGEFPAGQWNERNTHFSCKYRTPDGKSCPVGLLIPDYAYSSTFEGASADDDTIKDIVELPGGIFYKDLELIQELHDKFNPETWNADEFITGLNYLNCFSKVKQQEVA